MECPLYSLIFAYIATQVDKLAQSQLIDCGPQRYDLEKVLKKINDFKPALIIFTSFGWCSIVFDNKK